MVIDTHRRRQHSGERSVLTPRIQESPRCVERDDTLVIRIGDIHATVRADRHVGRPPESTLSASVAADGPRIAPPEVKHLDPIIPRIGHEDEFVRDCQSTRIDQLPRSHAEAAPFAQEGAVRGEHLNAMVAAVGDVHIAVRSDGDTPRSQKLGRAVTAMAPCAKCPARCVEHLNAMVPRVGDIDCVVGSDGRGGGRTQSVELEGKRAVLCVRSGGGGATGVLCGREDG